ncbi:MAG: GTP 3',8-cyclase MoaA [Halopseudomonas sp.]
MKKADSHNIIPIGPSPITIWDNLNRPLTDLRISVMDKCNFRCPYCMPEDSFNDSYRFLKQGERLSFGEINRLVRIFSRLGVKKVRLTGGEPLLRKGLPNLINGLSNIEGIEDIALTTNGALLGDQAAALKQAGLHRVTVSLDSVDPKIFLRMTGGKGALNDVLDGINKAQEAGLKPIKINTVVQRGVNDSAIIELLKRFRHSGIIVRLIEYMDVGTLNKWAFSKTIASTDLERQINAIWPLKSVASNSAEEVSSRHIYQDGGGEIGFISSISKPFCGDCSRARISSDGKLYTCLFSNSGFDLKKLLRSGSSDLEIEHTIRSRWSKRGDRYSEERAENKNTELSNNRIEMFHIGG